MTKIKKSAGDIYFSNINLNFSLNLYSINFKKKFLNLNTKIKMRKILFLPILLLLSLSESNCHQLPPTPTQNFKFSTTFDKYILYWDYNSQSITFELHVKDVDWVLFGIQGNNSFSDAIVASIYPDETGFFSEMAVSFDLKTKLNPNLNLLIYQLVIDQKFVFLHTK